METRRGREVRETEGTENVTGEVQSVDEAMEIFDQIMEKLDNNKEYEGGESRQISFGGTVSTA